MNPRHRRLLIPGLLVALLVVVLVAAVARRADGAVRPDATLVSRITDPRITESSGLAVSATHDDLAYTVNDSGNAPIVFAVQVSTGEVVGATRVTGVAWRDTEAMALDGDGTLWVADTGDNTGSRSDAALYAMPEPGPGDRTVRPTRYPVTYDDGPHDVEAVFVLGGRVRLLSKGLFSGTVYRLDDPLREDGANVAARTDGTVPGTTTDAAVAPDGRTVLVRTYDAVQVRDARSWTLERTDALPDQPQGESIAVEPSGRSYLVGSEGADSALFRIDLHLDTADSATRGPDPPDADAPDTGASDGGVPVAAVYSAVGVLVVGLAALVAVRVSRRRR